MYKEETFKSIVELYPSSLKKSSQKVEITKLDRNMTPFWAVFKMSS